MRANFWGAVAAAAALAVGSGMVQAQAPRLPIAGQNVTLAGTLKQVEQGPHEALFAGDDGRQYELDLAQAKILLPDGVRSPLLPGMRGTVSGLGNADGSITVSRFQVLPAAPLIPPDGSEPPDVTVRGTVETVNFEQGVFVLRINTHRRTVFVTADTVVSGLGNAAPGQFPVQPGQRVTVGGSLQPNGTLLAGLLTTKEDVNYLTAAGLPNRVLLGTVSAPANKLNHRDVKIRLADGTETKISVPRGIPIRRLGLQISVYDLSRRDQVRVTGRVTDTDFRAFRIDVLAPTSDAAGAPAGAARPGL